MRAILAALLTLSVLAGVAGTASADEYGYPRDFWQHEETLLP
jgi:hypothetical protein